jgi:hypothetical protein
LTKTCSLLCIGSVVETLVVPETLHDAAPPVGAIGRIVDAAGDFWIVAFPCPFVGANGIIQFSRDAATDLQLPYPPTGLRVAHGKTPHPTRLVVVRLDDQERVDGELRYGYGVHDVTAYPDLPLLYTDGDAESEESAESEEEFSLWLWSSEGLIERFYSNSDVQANQKALALCRENGWHVYAEE